MANETNLKPQRKPKTLLQTVPNLEPAPLDERDRLLTLVVDPPERRIKIPKLNLKKLAAQPLLEGAWKAFTKSCVCGTSYANNCAHYLTNAFALAGATFPAGYEKCPKGRLIRAKETLAWFKTLPPSGFHENHDSITDGIWFVYQEEGGQGHVCLHKESPKGYEYRGTTDLPDWTVQWHYFY